MTPTPCPACKGKCCRDEFGYRIGHMAAEFYDHVCEACWDGDYEARSEPEPAPKPVRTAEDERADVLAYIRRAIAYPFPVPGSEGPAGYLSMLHDLIAAGTHEGWAKNDG